MHSLLSIILFERFPSHMRGQAGFVFVVRVHRFPQQDIPRFCRADCVLYQIQNHGHRPLDFRVWWEHDLEAAIAIQWSLVGALDVASDGCALIAEPFVLIEWKRRSLHHLPRL